MSDEHKPTIDESLEALAHSLELLSCARYRTAKTTPSRPQTAESAPDPPRPQPPSSLQNPPYLLDSARLNAKRTAAQKAAAAQTRGVWTKKTKNEIRINPKTRTRYISAHKVH